jgi:hypothetical protein
VQGLSIFERTKTMDDLTRKVIERVAEGVWNQKYTSFGAYSQCTFCCVSPDEEHDEDCPVRLARRVLYE